jgi:hypothetical protein
VLAGELRAEAVENLSSETRGPILAATVLFDSADGARRGVELAGESGDHGSVKLTGKAACRSVS